MSLLSDEQAQEIFKSEHCNISKDLAGILYRAIEAAVLEAQKQEKWPFSADRVTYHKAAPVVQPGMVPERKIVTAAGFPVDYYNEGWNDCIDFVISAAEGKE